MYTSAPEPEVKPANRTKPAIDLRSDTVTKPSPEMRRAMVEAEVGDDVYAEDPTINRLERRAAEIFGREAALFVPSGTMGNQIAIKLHTHHGQELICHERAHVFEYEMAMMAHFSGVAPRTVAAADGILTWKHIEPKLRPKSYHGAQTGLVSLENTHNMGGGTVTPPEIFDEVCDEAHSVGLPVHLDGARIFNAAVALSPARQIWGRRSVAVANAGSLRAGPHRDVAGDRALSRERAQVRLLMDRRRGRARRCERVFGPARIDRTLGRGRDRRREHTRARWRRQ